MKLNDDAHDQFSIMCFCFFFLSLVVSLSLNEKKNEYQNQIHSHAMQSKWRIPPQSNFHNIPLKFVSFIVVEFLNSFLPVLCYCDELLFCLKISQNCLTWLEWLQCNLSISISQMSSSYFSLSVAFIYFFCWQNLHNSTTLLWCWDTWGQCDIHFRQISQKTLNFSHISTILKLSCSFSVMKRWKKYKIATCGGCKM